MKKTTLITVAALVMAAMMTVISCSSGNNKSEESDGNGQTDFLQTGKAAVQDAGSTLKGQLVSQLEKGGVPIALFYCNLNASGLADSISAKHNVTISRRAIRYRNPANAADALDKEVFAAFEAKMADGAQPEPVVRDEDGKKHYFEPIIMQPMCTTCHGDPDTEIGMENLALIQGLYRNDLAVNFKPGDLRGIWRVDF